MDFQGFANTFDISCAVISVQKTFDGRCGEVRIVKANDIYKETMGVVRYHDNMLYSELVPKDIKFEDFCFHAAVLKEKMHSYVETPGLNTWSDITAIPLSCEDRDTYYCAFYFEFTRTPEADRMSKVSAETAETVIKNCITLRGSDDFHTAITSVISDLQEKTDSLCSSIFLVDKQNKKYSVLCDKVKNNIVHFSDFSAALPYEIVASWETTIGKTNGLIIKNESDLEELAKINPKWAASLKIAHTHKALFFIRCGKKKTQSAIFSS